MNYYQNIVPTQSHVLSFFKPTLVSSELSSDESITSSTYVDTSLSVSPKVVSGKYRATANIVYRTSSTSVNGFVEFNDGTSGFGEYDAATDDVTSVSKETMCFSFIGDSNNTNLLKIRAKIASGTFTIFGTGSGLSQLRYIAMRST